MSSESLRTWIREQRTIEEGDDAPFVLGGTLVEGLRVVDVGQIPELDRVTRSLRVDEVEVALELPPIVLIAVVIDTNCRCRPSCANRASRCLAPYFAAELTRSQASPTALYTPSRD